MLAHYSVFLELIQKCDACHLVPTFLCVQCNHSVSLLELKLCFAHFLHFIDASADETIRSKTDTHVFYDVGVRCEKTPQCSRRTNVNGLLIISLLFAVKNIMILCLRPEQCDHRF